MKLAFFLLIFISQNAMAAAQFANVRMSPNNAMSGQYVCVSSIVRDDSGSALRDGRVEVVSALANKVCNTQLPIMFIQGDERSAELCCTKL